MDFGEEVHAESIERFWNAQLKARQPSGSGRDGGLLVHHLHNLRAAEQEAAQPVVVEIGLRVVGDGL